ncbi:hypothetical protein ABENE_01040 [Asticcacaulis benevestitus DSM 16100 = ATCC BAA-896]|uniref:Uncharacterized protein n=1 Tax=Asticcacaulis benevestitus DSM 16100 = ATCC BAA-896 TaxID=1121022 RepID=V4Q3Z0_9CAUL|nr:hypothetical protein ABENE_01040 [Asticcacaulis benevestitus DSM 16100 = ATCC BAA-896]
MVALPPFLWSDLKFSVFMSRLQTEPFFPIVFPVRLFQP